MANIVLVDNKPRYKKGELFGAELFGEFVVGILQSSAVVKRTPYDLKKIEEIAVEGMSVNANEIWYETEFGGRVRENGITHIGHEAVNKKIKIMQEELDRVNNILNEVRSIV
jgi:hypothetical protein